MGTFSQRSGSRIGALVLCDHDSSVSQLCFPVECIMVAVGMEATMGLSLWYAAARSTEKHYET